MADVGRREALAEKIAQEWEEHLELTIARDELAQSGQTGSSGEFNSIATQIKYKEDRIRQLAVRLGKRQYEETVDVESDKETFLFDKKFKNENPK